MLEGGNSMNEIIEKYALDCFGDDEKKTTTSLITFDFGLEAWELKNILNNLYLNKSNWKIEDFDVDGYKQYDENYSSYWVGILLINVI